MTVLQAQRLPGSILDAAKDRIVYAIRRGILGELGREGKKGAISESLKVRYFTSLLLFAPLLTNVS